MEHAAFSVLCTYSVTVIFLFTPMMQHYGMGGTSTEASPQETSQSLQRTVVMVWAIKVKDTE